MANYIGNKFGQPDVDKLVSMKITRIARVRVLKPGCCEPRRRTDPPPLWLLVSAVLSGAEGV